MYKKISILFLSILLLLQISNTKAARPGPQNHARALLNQLRKVTRVALTKAFKDYSIMSDLVHSAALETKIRGASHAVIQCVNHRAEDAKFFILSASISVRAHAELPASEKEKELVACGRTDERCINTIIRELQSKITSVPNYVNRKITVDRHKVNEQISLIKACGRHFFKSHWKVIPSRSSVEAKALLNRLRQVTINNLNLEGTALISFIDVVGSTVQETKAWSGGNSLTKCVNGHAFEAIDSIYTANSKITERFLKAIYVEERKWVLCEVSNERCINNVITAIRRKIPSIPGNIKNNVRMEKQNVDKHIEAIRACRFRSRISLFRDTWRKM